MAARCSRQSRTDRLLVRESTATDVLYVAERLSIEDVAELVAATGLQPKDALSLAHSQSDQTWAGVLDGDVVVVGGALVDSEGLSANVWLLCLPGAKSAPRELARAIRRRVNDLSDHHGLLWGYVDDRNETRKRWLKMLGFSMTDEVTRYESFLKLPFRLFVNQT